MSKVMILIPVYNDWQSVLKLIEKINSEALLLDGEFSIIIINDASTENKPAFAVNLNNLKSIKIVNMKENKGHAKCNATGLKYINEKEDFDYVIPMDGDGEDKPEELSLLFNKAKENLDRVVVATRFKRSEDLLFKFFYTIHLCLTFIFTGRLIKFGNYTFLPKFFVMEAVKDPDLWNSFVGTIEKLAKKKANILSIRGSRYFGSSKMNFINLVKHSLSIMSIFKKTLLIRSTFFIIFYIFLIIENISVITLMPILAIVVMIIFIIKLSKRKNILELNDSLKNIQSIDEIK
jgi:glycosyltransferase involved in cell wall biosynthesis